MKKILGVILAVCALSLAGCEGLFSGTLQKNYPDAQIICILGNRIDGEYGKSGHAQMAKRIYEKTLYLFQ